MTKKIDEATRKLLHDTWEECFEQDKSIEYSLQYMQDVANVDLETVGQFIKEKQRREEEERHNSKRK